MTVGRNRPQVYVLVHGAHHGGWCWRLVAAALRRAGHTVYTPTQTGLADRRHLMSREITMETFVLDVVNLMESEELTDVVLVGHSFGGRTATGVADRCPERLGHLCFLDAGLPIGGASRLEAMPAHRRAERVEAAAVSSGGVSVPAPPATRFGLTDPAHLAWVNRRLTPQPLSVEASRIELAHEIGNGVPCTYIRLRDERFPIDMLGSDAYARDRRDWTYAEVDGAHDAMICAPELVTGLLSGATSDI
jgi:pimeloyl-ACP methyl ester carboxylesterase